MKQQRLNLKPFYAPKFRLRNPGRMSELTPTGYQYRDTMAQHTQAYLWEAVFEELKAFPWPSGKKRVFELGCGNGALATVLSEQKFDVIGVDPSEDGIRIANQAYPNLALHVGSAYDDLAQRFGRFSAVVSLEVIEHVFYPRKYAKCLFELLEPDGIALVSTPYHSYWKNLTLALTGKMDSHFTALWDYGHIKFWSIRTLTSLLHEAGLEVVHFKRLGRVPFLAKSMMAVARRPCGK